MTNVELAKRVGISAPNQCLRRRPHVGRGGFHPPLSCQGRSAGWIRGAGLRHGRLAKSGPEADLSAFERAARRHGRGARMSHAETRGGFFILKRRPRPEQRSILPETEQLTGCRQCRQRQNESGDPLRPRTIPACPSSA